MGGVSFCEGGNHSSANVTNLTSADQKWSFEFTVTLSAILSLVDLCIIVGNSMVLLVIIRHRGMRTRTNLFLVNLAVADLLVGLCVVPFTITTLIENRWVFGNGAVCLFNGWMNSFCLISSIHTLMYISIHKYFSIVRPLSNPLKLSYIIGMMAAAWAWAGICSTMNVTGLIVEHKPGTSQCGPKYPNDPKTYIIHSIIQITVIVVPFVILVFCYIRMFQEIKGHSQRLRTNSTVAEDLILSQQKKVAVTLLIVLATFVIMALPYFAYANYTTVVKDKTHFSIYLNPLTSGSQSGLNVGSRMKSFSFGYPLCPLIGYPLCPLIGYPLCPLIGYPLCPLLGYPLCPLIGYPLCPLIGYPLCPLIGYPLCPLIGYPLCPLIGYPLL
ncbi:hypothetical protein Btru_027558 [Bulinus truncatus]|nr:hypothetical protein Btru_027558 [Bulinus truncatus]